MTKTVTDFFKGDAVLVENFFCDMLNEILDNENVEKVEFEADGHRVNAYETDNATFVSVYSESDGLVAYFTLPEGLPEDDEREALFKGWIGQAKAK